MVEGANPSIKVSVSIVTYNNADEITTVTDSLLKYTKNVALSLYIVDNHSADHTVQVVKDTYGETVHLLALQDNLGFGHGHNQVLDHIDSDYHAIINPDIEVHSDILYELADYMEQHPEIALITPKILNADGTEQFLPKKFPRIKYLLGGRLETKGKLFKKWRAEYTMAGQNLTEPAEIQFCTGCFMFIRTEVFKKIKGFDERYFMYFEDADLTRESMKYGRVIFQPAFSVTHNWERASAKQFKFFKIQVQSMFKYFFKWRGKKH